MEEYVGDVGGLLGREVPSEGSEAAFHQSTVLMLPLLALVALTFLLHASSMSWHKGSMRPNVSTCRSRDP